jgi:CRP-like cAMP-binding protein
MIGEENKNQVSEDLARALPRLTPDQVAEVSPQFIRQSYGPGETIIRQGDPPDRFYIVLSGTAEVCHEGQDGHIEVIDLRRPGEYFGEVGLIQDRPRTATLRAPHDSEVEVLALEQQDFQELMEESKATEMHLAQEMIRRLITLADAQ